jgi:RNA polymerase sigma factor (sigma-70 family)
MAKVAFSVLVQRYGPIVMSTCRAVLRDRDQAEDAFQATFLVLATRAQAVRRDGSLGAWLHGVALRVAACARSREARRARHEQRYAEMTMQKRGLQGNDSHQEFDDQARVLHEEIEHLPSTYLSAVVLCYLQELTHDQAADRLGWPVGTVRSRLARARDRLRVRLDRRGLAPSALPAVLSGAGLVSEPGIATNSVATVLTEATVRGAFSVGSGKASLTGIVSAEAIALMAGVLKTMITNKLTLLAMTVLVAGLVTTGAGVAAYSGLRQGDDQEILLAGAQNAAEKQSDKQATTSPISPKPAPSVQGPPLREAKEKRLRRSEESVRKLVGDFESETQAFSNAVRKAKSAEERQVLLSGRRASPASIAASYAGALL